MKRVLYMSSFILIVILGYISVSSTLKSISLTNCIKDLESDLANSHIVIDELEESINNLTNENEFLVDQLTHSQKVINELEDEIISINIAAIKDISPLSITETYLKGLWSAKPLDQYDASFDDKIDFSNEKLRNLSPYISDQLKQIHYNVSTGISIYDFAEVMNIEIKPSEIEVTLRTEYEDRMVYDYILYFDNLQDQDNNESVNFTGSLVTIKDGDRWIVDTDSTSTVIGQIYSYMTRQGVSW